MCKICPKMFCHISIIGGASGDSAPVTRFGGGRFPQSATRGSAPGPHWVTYVRSPDPVPPGRLCLPNALARRLASLMRLTILKLKIAPVRLVGESFYIIFILNYIYKYECRYAFIIK